ncbi:restriction endonuclease subunit S [Methanosphaera cuniculi]|uniref:restriction endonuclease subunit S n=1 Tax=Methanosphaera cuniculi TaxID=1077256 RepID=UPI0026ED3201|nr:restriction endonuclease subunit S [Methanosphaera cuniculi]
MNIDDKNLNSNENDKIIFNFKENCKFIKGKKPKEICNFNKKHTELYLTIDVLKGQENIYGNTENTIHINKNDILIVSDGASSGDIYYGKEGILGSTLSKIEISNEYADIILEYLKYYSKQIKKNNTGSAIPHVDKGFILSLEIELPENSKYIQDIFQTLHKKIIKNNEEVELLSKLRDTLLPKLLSGELDVSGIEV